MQLGAESLDDDFVILALRQAGDRYGTNYPRTRNCQRKSAAVCRKFGQRQPKALDQGDFSLFQVEAHSIRTPMKARHHIGFAACPFDIVRSASDERRKEKGLAEAPNIDYERHIPRGRCLTQPASELPRIVLSERRELKSPFLLRNSHQVFAYGHVTFLYLRVLTGCRFCATLAV